MNSHTIKIAILVISISFFLPAQTKAQDNKRNNLPNIVILLADDQGYADVSYHQHPKEVSTPSIDKLAETGVVFTNGYASGYVCSPTRAGLLTGRYQQRFGFYRAPDSRQGLPLSEVLLPEVIKEKGYNTAIFGKWHLGLEKPYYPTSRGFDEFYGFLGHGGHDYFDLNCEPDDKYTCIYRNDKPINDSGYLTDNLAREACRFIDDNKNNDSPFLLYLPFNAVHYPLQAPEKDINKYNTGNEKRNIQLAMLYRMDIAVGNVINKLKETGQYENTLIIYFNDNGGASRTAAINTPLRDYKHSVYEGGIRVPFIISWPGKIKPGINDEPVISLDIMPTICAAAGIDLPKSRIYDGKNILPIINKTKETPLHDYLFWDGNDGIWAVRNQKWKLLKNKKGELELYNLVDDISETENLAKEYPEIVSSLSHKYDEWREEMETPMSPGRHLKK